jgi:hypothetical protein
MARLKPRADGGPQLDPDLMTPYSRPSTSEAGRSLLVGIQAVRERNRSAYGRPVRQFVEHDDLNQSDDLDGEGSP